MYGCVISGYIMSITGCMHIYTMTAISFERFYILKNPTSIKQIDSIFIHKIILILVLVSLFWSSIPLFGWSYYSLEDGLLTCSVEWKERSFNVISYNICIFIFVFFLPFCVIFFSNLNSLFIVS